MDLASFNSLLVMGLVSFNLVILGMGFDYFHMIMVLLIGCGHWWWFLIYYY